MQVLLDLLADRGEHAGRAMANIEAADAAGKIEIPIAVDVLDGGAFGASGENRRGVRRAAVNGRFSARDQCAGFGSRYLRANLNCRHICFPCSEIYYQPIGVSSRLTK